jgi:hypothetical protein
VPHGFSFLKFELIITHTLYDHPELQVLDGGKELIITTDIAR